MKPERAQFIATVSLFFIAMAMAQLPVMIGFGLMTMERFWMSCLALIPLVAFMPLGALIARHVPRSVFDKIILVMLSFIAVQLIANVIAGS